MQILKRTGRFVKATLVYPNGKTRRIISNAAGIPLLRYCGVLAVALSRKFRVERDIASQLPKNLSHQSEFGRNPGGFRRP